MRGPLQSALISFGILALGASIPSRAGVVTLTFDTFKDGEAIGDYYNGGSGSMGSGPGPKDGIVFGPNALALNVGPNSNFANNPSAAGILYFDNPAGTATGAAMNVAAGFTTKLSFYYSAAYAGNPGAVTIYDGLNQTGNVLATAVLPVTPTLPPGTPDFNNWVAMSVSFAGTAKSVFLSGTAATFIAFDNITLGDSAPPVTIPEPSSLAMAGLGCLCGLGFLARRRAVAG